MATEKRLAYFLTLAGLGIRLINLGKHSYCFDEGLEINRALTNPWLDLPREELRPVVTYVQQWAQPGDFIYVYYGAVPAYKVYQPDSAYPTHLGQWFRGEPLEEKVGQIQQSVGNAPRF
ncbi:MAG TPA: hypothetical protein VF177_22345 [Anaerolineae bacterium]